MILFTHKIDEDSEVEYVYTPKGRMPDRTEDGPPDEASIKFISLIFAGRNILCFLEEYCESYLEELSANLLAKHNP